MSTDLTFVAPDPGAVCTDVLIVRDFEIEGDETFLLIVSTANPNVIVTTPSIPITILDCKLNNISKHFVQFVYTNFQSLLS